MRQRHELAECHTSLSVGAPLHVGWSNLNVALHGVLYTDTLSTWGKDNRSQQRKHRNLVEISNEPLGQFIKIFFPNLVITFAPFYAI